MQELNRLDRPLEKPAYCNVQVAELHHCGLLSRAEAETLDIIYTGFAQSQEDEIEFADTNEEEEQWEPSCVAVVHDGAVIPILNLDDLIQQPETLAEKRMACKQAVSIIYDVLLSLLDEQEGDQGR